MPFAACNKFYMHTREDLCVCLGVCRCVCLWLRLYVCYLLVLGSVFAVVFVYMCFCAFSFELLSVCAVCT